MIRPLFLAPDMAPPQRTLAVDCTGSGADAVYSHWRDAPAAPPELADDTSTGILLRAAADSARWLAGFARVANDHIDADGLLAIAVACNPDVALAHAQLLIGAAEAGDFSEWPGEPAFRLMLRVHQVIRDQRQRGSDWQQRSCDAVADDLQALIEQSAQPDAERDAQIAQVVAVRARLAARDGFAIGLLGDLASIAWDRRCGHATDAFTTVHEPDDLPVWALAGLFPDTTFQLLVERRSDGLSYRLDAPRHSWARTVRRPTVAWPDLRRCRTRLQSLEPLTGCRWLAFPESRSAGFVCLLACVDGDGRPGPSGLAATVVESAVREGLRARA